MENDKIREHKSNIIQQILHPSEYLMGLKLKDERKGLLNISAPMGANYQDILLCEKILNETSKNISIVIKELPDCLRLPIALFYLYYKTLDVLYGISPNNLDNFNDFITTDISNDIIPTNLQIKQSLLSDFYKILASDKIPNFDTIDAEKQSYNELLSNIHIYNNVFKTLPEYHQEIIIETIKNIGNGMGEYSNRDLTSGTENKYDFEEYNIKISGELAVGFTKQFIGTNLEANSFNSDGDNILANKMGCFLKKTNIIRDYYKDLLNKKSYWPNDVWSLYRKTLPELRFGESSDVACLNHMITDALEDIPFCIEYLSKIQNPKVFRFCAIPQIRAMAILAEAYNNRNVFTGVITIRKGLWASILNTCNNIKDVHEWYQKFASQILDKVSSNDPNATRIVESLKELKAKKNYIPYQFQELVSILLIVAIVFVIAMCVLYIRPNFYFENGAFTFRLIPPPEISK